MTINTLLQHEEATAVAGRTSASFTSVDGSSKWVVVDFTTAIGITSISDNKGNTFGAPLFTQSWTAGNSSIRAYFIPAAAGGTGHTITVNSGSADKVGILVVEDTGVPTLVASSAASNEDSLEPRTSNTGVAAQVGDLVVGCDMASFGADPSFILNNAGAVSRGAVLSGGNTHNPAMITFTYLATTAAVQTISVTQTGADAALGVFLLRYPSAGAAKKAMTHRRQLAARR